MPRFMIAAAHKSSGKTVISAGVAAAMSARGLSVQGFKKGPDYIDPMWLTRATGRPCYNLDFNALNDSEIATLFASRARGADISLVEANKGLFDGVCPDGTDSNAALAKRLGLPVVLVVDTRGMTRGIAPLLLGYRAFDPEVRIAGVILNRTGGSRHEGKLRQAVETYTDLSVLGAVGASPSLDISERHLGLTTPSEWSQHSVFLESSARRIAAQVEIDRLVELAGTAPDLPGAPMPRPAPRSGAALRIGIARDEAFAFYYPDDLERFEAAGAELVPVDMLRDQALPELDGLLIGGGFPETQMEALAANSGMRGSLRAALEAGLPCYAECGGLMYLCRSLSWHGETRPMVGFLEADAVMHARPQGRGYVRFAGTPQALWGSTPEERRAHEFHYASLENVAAPVYARRITRGQGIDGAHDGLVKANTQAGFVHLRDSAATPWVSDFLRFVSGCRDGAARKNPALEGRG
ncbi:cobyrinate a,c-diamide synthase [Tropicimonas sp. IMCC6043]|nr:cobyrinate a,c-diamide synthase [Tropicimonas sp. IMCC6043]